jgi:predicted Rossmann fold nucleotide-binding protein DprA/Smf involved in DNA uptake
MDKITIISSDPYGKSIAQTIAAEFTAEGFTIVSGIAREAHCSEASN